MAEAVYLLCALTSIFVMWLLLRGWRRTRTRLLFWSSLCFVGLAVNNSLLFLDLVVVTDVDLSLARNLSAALSPTVLLFGLIWETNR